MICFPDDFYLTPLSKQRSHPDNPYPGAVFYFKIIEIFSLHSVETPNIQKYID